MSYETLRVERDGAVMTVTLNRPQVRNAASNQLIQDLYELTLALRREREVRVLILTGAGHSFSAGADLKEAPSYTVDDFRRRRELMGHMFGQLENLDQVSIAAVNGYALGFGCELALACDVRVAAANAVFGYPEPRVGVVSPTQRLVHIVGLGRARDILYTARMVDAAEAERIGLANRVVPPERLLEEARAMAAQMLELSPLALKYTKVAVQLGLASGVGAAQRYEGDTSVLCAASEDRQEALRAWAAKRKPQWLGR